MSVLARIFLVLLLVALPPLLILSLLFTFGTGWAESLGRGTTLLVVTLGAIGWAAVVGLFTARSFGRDVDALINVAERRSTTDDPTTEAQRRLRAALDQRDAQIAALAAHVRAVPITDNATSVAHRVVNAVRVVTDNPTWSFAVLQSSADDELAVGVYGTGEHEVGPIDEVHRWASVMEADDTTGVRFGEGAWGAFVVVDIGEEDLLRGILLAPWEGRLEPGAADRNLLLLVGQHASLALEHALLYARARRQAEELDRMAVIQRDFLRGITHDLQTPLTSIRAVAAELRAGTALDPTAVDDLLVIEHQADRLRRMVAQLLAVSRLEAGALQPQVDVVRVEPLVQRTWQALRANRPFTLEREGARHLAVADSDRLEQVLWALLDNAVKYSPDGEPIAVRLFTELGPNGALWSVTEVVDRGVGMDQETQRRAFEQFYRSDVARRLVPDGSGVGLYAASGLIRAMGGSISVLTAGEGQGTTVSIRLPAEAVETPDADTAANEGTGGVPADQAVDAR
jgi:signal transduction histidine kinase